MIIKDLELTHFGKFHGKKIEFQPGINIYYGENEAGKSTIHAFIRSMLFGIERQRGRAARSDRYTRYEPWENRGGYEGKMRIEINETVYRLERGFLKIDRYFRLYDETNGDELKPAQEQLENLLGGLTETGFLNTVCIEQLKCATDASLINELQNFVCNTGNTRSTEIDLKAATLTLKMQRKRLENRLISTVAKDLAVNKKSLEETEEEIKQLRIEEKERSEEGAQLKERLNEERELSINVKLAHRKEKEALRKRYEEAKKEYHDYRVDTYGMVKKNTPSLVMVAVGLLAACGVLYCLWNGAISSLLKVFIVIGLCVITAGCLTAAYFYRTYFLQQKDQLRSQIEEKEEKRRLADQYEEEYLQLASQPPENTSDNSMVLMDKIKALQEALGRVSWDIEQKEEYRMELLNEQDGLLEQQDENARLQSEIKAVDLATETIHKLANKVHNSFGVELNEEASEMLESITGRKYSSLVIKDDMSIFLNTPDRYVPVEGVSRGTMEQIYLCIRLAASKLLWEKGDMPLLFDDIFVFYDDERLKETMKFLSRIPNQVIIFTCHKREMEYTEQ